MSRYMTSDQNIWSCLVSHLVIAISKVAAMSLLLGEERIPSSLPTLKRVLPRLLGIGAEPFRGEKRSHQLIT